MRRMWTLSCGMLLVALVIGVFSISNRVQQSEKKINHMQSEMDDEQEGLRVLQAEWTYLNNPERLEKLARTYFSLQPVSGGQYIRVANIPLRTTLDTQAAQADKGADEAESLASIEPGVEPEAPAVAAPAAPPAMEDDEVSAPTAEKEQITMHIKRVSGDGVGAALPPVAAKPLPDVMPNAVQISTTSDQQVQVVQ